MTLIGYLYYPQTYPQTLGQLDPQDSACLQQAGATDVFLDWGSRQSLNQVLSLIEQQSTDGLVVMQLADLGDSVAACHQIFLRILQSGCQLFQVNADGGIRLFRDPQDWLIALSDLPQILRSRVMQQRYARNRLDKKPPPGAAPYGYKREENRYVLERRQAALVKAFFEHFLVYGSLRESVRYLEKQGKKISVATGRRWLSHPVYRGDLAFPTAQPGESVIRNTHNPILSRDEAAQIDRWLKRNRVISRRSASAPRALAGLVKCQACGSALRIIQTTHRGRDPYLYLRCPTCRYGLGYSSVLDQIIDLICTQLPQKLNNWDATPLAGIKAQIEGQIAHNEGILAQLPALEQQGILDASTHHYRRFQLEQDNTTLLAQLEQFPPADLPQVARNLSIRPFWDDLSEIERRRYFREFIHQVLAQSDGAIQITFVFEALLRVPKAVEPGAD